MEGWIKLHRKLQEHPFWQEKRKFSKAEAWIDLLLMANHKDDKVLFGNQMTTVKRGQLITSEIKLSKRWDWSRDRVRRFLDLLKNEGMITKESDRNKTTITIVNYEVYQDITTTNKTTNETTDQHPTEHEANLTVVWGENNTTNKTIKTIENIGFEHNSNTTNRQSTRQPADNQQDTNKNNKNNVPTEHPIGCEQDIPNKKQVIAEMVAVYRSIPRVEPRKADYSFLGQLFNEYGSGPAYGAIKALKRRMESGPVDDPYSYLTAVAKAKAAEAKSKVTPLRRTSHPMIPPGYNMPSLEDLKRQRQVEAEMEAIRQERLRRRREMNGGA